MNLKLQQKNVLITGASKGIGLACARRFKNEGAHIALVSRNDASLNRAAESLGGAMVFAADLSDSAAAEDIVCQAEEQLGPVDILVNCAGAAQRTVPEELSPETWRAAMDAKYFSYINVIDPLIKRMAARKKGAIINIIGTGGKTPVPVHLPGGAANAALMLITAGLASAYTAQGIQVIGISPGLTNTERVEEGLKAEAKRQGVSEADALSNMVAQMPLGRLTEPDEIASIVAFAASRYGVVLSGTNITADGAATPFVV